MSTFLRDLRVAARQLAGHPSFTLIVVVTLALSIGAMTTCFAVLNAVAFRPLPFTDPDRLVAVHAVDRRGGGWSRLSLGSFAALQHTQGVFSGSVRVRRARGYGDGRRRCRACAGGRGFERRVLVAWRPGAHGPPSCRDRCGHTRCRHWSRFVGGRTWIRTPVSSGRPSQWMETPTSSSVSPGVGSAFRRTRACGCRSTRHRRIGPSTLSLASSLVSPERRLMRPWRPRRPAACSGPEMAARQQPRRPRCGRE